MKDKFIERTNWKEDFYKKFSKRIGSGGCTMENLGIIPDIIEFIESTRRQQKRKMLEKINSRVGFLRQWLNEERVDKGGKLVTNEDIKLWLRLEDK